MTHVADNPVASSPRKRERTCIACGGKAVKGGLLRIVRTPDGAVVFDATGKASGRGAYVCSAECAERVGAERLGRALKTKVTPETMQDVANALHEHLEAVER